MDRSVLCVRTDLRWRLDEDVKSFCSTHWHCSGGRALVGNSDQKLRYDPWLFLLNVSYIGDNQSPLRPMALDQIPRQFADIWIETNHVSSAVWNLKSLLGYWGFILCYLFINEALMSSHWNHLLLITLHRFIFHLNFRLNNCQ